VAQVLRRLFDVIGYEAVMMMPADPDSINGLPRRR
jgi:hypothetical protein